MPTVRSPTLLACCGSGRGMSPSLLSPGRSLTKSKLLRLRQVRAMARRDQKSRPSDCDRLPRPPV
jgi:hypothetical protein